MILYKLTIGNQLIIPWQLCQFPWKKGCRVNLRKEGGFPVERGTAVTFPSYYWFGTPLGCYALQVVDIVWFALILRVEEMIVCCQVSHLAVSSSSPRQWAYLSGSLWIQFGCCSCGALDRKHLLEVLKGSSKHRTSDAVLGVLGLRKGKLSASLVLCFHSEKDLQVKQ